MTMVMIRVQFDDGHGEHQFHLFLVRSLMFGIILLNKSLEGLDIFTPIVSTDGTDPDRRMMVINLSLIFLNKLMSRRPMNVKSHLQKCRG
jgi:hypothetical protein